MPANEIEIELRTLYKPDGQSIKDQVSQDAQQAGQAIEQEFRRASEVAGRELQGIGDKAQRAFADVRPPPGMQDQIVRPLREAGDRGGQELAEGITSGVDQIDFSSIGGNLVSALSSLGAAGPVGAAAAAIGVVFADEIQAGFDRGWNANRNRIALSIRTGFEGVDLAEIGRAGGRAYSDGFGESLAEVRNSAALIKREIEEFDSSLNLDSATRKVEAFAQTFGTTVSEQIRVAQRLVSTDLVGSFDEAMDLMVDIAQRFPNSFEEIFDVLTEFTPVFAKMGIDGAQAANLIGEAWRNGLLPNIDRGAELFEEFNIEITDSAGRARPAIEALGISFEEMQNKLANGRGAEAAAQIARALLEVEDAARRNELALEIFGTSIESAADPEHVLQFFAMADAQREVGAASDELVASVEEQIREWDKFSRTVEEVVAELAELASEDMNQLISGFSSLADILGDVGDEFVRLSTGGTVAGGAIELIADNLDDMQSKARESHDATARTTQHFMDLNEGAMEASSGVDDLTGAVEALDDAMAEFSGRFDVDDAFRALDEDVLRLTESLGELEGVTFDVATGFDTSTEAGINAEKMMQDLSGNLDTLTGLYRDGQIDLEQFSAGHASIEAALRTAAAQMGLNQAETDALIAKYGLIPTDILTLIMASGNAWDQADSARQKLNAIPLLIQPRINVTSNAASVVGSTVTSLNNIAGRTWTTFLNTVRRTIYQTVGTNPNAGSGARAHGGPVEAAADGGFHGSTTLVNEGSGPELARLPSGDLVDLPHGTTVVTAEDSARIRGEARGSGGDTIVNVFPQNVISNSDLTGIIRDAIVLGDFSGQEL